MTKRLVIVGGGIAGLAAGIYGRASGFDTTIVEHDLAFGGASTTWSRDGYTIDGGVHFLTGGPFMRLYDELGITHAVEFRTVEHWATWRDVRSGAIIPVTRDLNALARDLRALAPSDAAEIARIMEAAERFAGLSPPGMDQAPELAPMRDQLHALWAVNEAFSTVAHFRKPLRTWAHEHVESGDLARFFCRLVPDEAPALLLLMTLGYLQRGYLTRPVGGAARVRDALAGTYGGLGGKTLPYATADEILVERGRVRGVRLTGGVRLHADDVISTSSTPETVFRLLGGRFGVAEARERTAASEVAPPITLASFGLSSSLFGFPSLLLVDGLEPFDIGGCRVDHLHLRLCNDDPDAAPQGHSVLQALFESDDSFWVTRGTAYGAAKTAVSDLALTQIERAIPNIRGLVGMTDVATPLTHWNRASSWRRAYEGWMPSTESMLGHARKTLPGVTGLFLAGQWLEPGCGVPMAVLCARQATELLCAEEKQRFVAGPPHPSSAHRIREPIAERRRARAEELVATRFPRRASPL